MAADYDAPQTRRGSLANGILSWALLVFLFLVPIPLGSNRPPFWGLNAMLIGLVAAVYFVTLLLRGASLRITPRQLGPAPLIFAALCLFLLLQLTPFGAAGPISAAPGATLLMLLRQLSFGLLFFLVLQAASNGGRAETMLLGMLAIAVLHALGALLMLRSGDTTLGFAKWAYLGSATGAFVNRNSFATFMAFGLVLAGALLLDALYKTQRHDPEAPPAGGWGRVAILATAFCAIVAALVASQSRMGVLAAGLGLLTVLLCGLFARRQINRSILLGVAGALLVAMLIALLNSGGLVERLLFSEESWAIRSALYRQVLGLIAQRPWTGFGGGSFEVIFPSVHQLPVAIDRVWDKAHNTYLTLWVELGLLAGTAMLVLLGLLGWRLLRALRRTPARWLPLSTALGALMVAASHSLVDFSLEIQAVAFWFMALLAIGLAQAVDKSQEPLPFSAQRQMNGDGS